MAYNQNLKIDSMMEIYYSARLFGIVFSDMRLKILERHTYSVKQLTAGCVDETAVHFGFMVDNDYDIRFIEYNELNRSLSLAIVIG